MNFCQNRGLEFDAINDNLPEAVVRCKERNGQNAAPDAVADDDAGRFCKTESGFAVNLVHGSFLRSFL